LTWQGPTWQTTPTHSGFRTWLAGTTAVLVAIIGLLAFTPGIANAQSNALVEVTPGTVEVGQSFSLRANNCPGPNVDPPGTTNRAVFGIDYLPPPQLPGDPAPGSYSVDLNFTTLLDNGWWVASWSLPATAPTLGGTYQVTAECIKTFQGADSLRFAYPPANLLVTPPSPAVVSAASSTVPAGGQLSVTASGCPTAPFVGADYRVEYTVTYVGVNGSSAQTVAVPGAFGDHATTITLPANAPVGPWELTAECRANELGSDSLWFAYAQTVPFHVTSPAGGWGTFVGLGVPNWHDGPAQLDGHSIVSNASGETALVALKDNRDLYVRRSADGVEWDPWVKLGVGGWSSADVAIDDSGRVEIIAVKADGRLYTRSWLAMGSFDPWVSHGLATWDPLAKPSISTSGSRIALGAVKSDGRLFTRERSLVGPWGAFTRHGSATWAQVDVDQASDGSLWFVGSKSDGRLYTRSRLGSSWGSFTKQGRPTWDPTIAPSITVEANNVAVFGAVKADGRLYTREWSGVGSPSGFVRHGVDSWAGVSLDSDGAGGVGLVANKDFGVLYTRWFSTGSWGSWRSHGKSTWSNDTAPSIAAGDGTPQFLAVKWTGALWTRAFNQQ